MEKLTIVGNFTKTLELLRNTECTSKEKINYFHQISDIITSPAMTSQTNYSKYCSNSIGILLLFCEDLDTAVRMNAEENLNKIIRSMETNRVSRILFDLLNEIKKNGNERSLRICLKLFAYYCPRLKEKNVKWYGLKLLPCIQTIAKRKERDLQETLVKFMESYGSNLQICLTDNETIKLLEVILLNLLSECPVKRRSACQISVILIENSKNKSYVANYAIDTCIVYLKIDAGDKNQEEKQHRKDKNQQSNVNNEKKVEQSVQQKQQTNTLLGVLGFFRLLFPILISQNLAFDLSQTIEIYDFCLYLLNNQNHSIINASLEVINSILLRLPGNERLVEIFTNGNKIDGNDDFIKSNESNNKRHEEFLLHNEYLKKRKSLKNQIFQLVEKKSRISFDLTTAIPPPRPPKPSPAMRQTSSISNAIRSTTGSDEWTCNALNKKEKGLDRNKEENKQKCSENIFHDDTDNGADDARKLALKTTITNDFSDALTNKKMNKQRPAVENVNTNKKISSGNLFADDDDDGLVTISPYFVKTMTSGGGVTSKSTPYIDNLDKNSVLLDDEDETIVIRTGSDDDDDDGNNGIGIRDGEKKQKIKISLHHGKLKDDKLKRYLDLDIDNDDNDGIDNDDNKHNVESYNLNQNQYNPSKIHSKSMEINMMSSAASSLSAMEIAEGILREGGERAFLEEIENSDGFTTITTDLNESDDNSHMRINTSEEKSQHLSDMDNESFNSIDFESEITIDGEIQQQQQFTQHKDKHKRSDDDGCETATASKSANDWKLQKSTDSIGSFFNSLLSSSHTESVTKLFRPSTTKQSLPTSASESKSIANASCNSMMGGNENQQIGKTVSAMSEDSIHNPEQCDSSTAKLVRDETGGEEHNKTEFPTAINADVVDISSPSLSATMLTLETPKMTKKHIIFKTLEDDTTSLESINSRNSMFSHVSYQSSVGVSGGGGWGTNDSDVDVLASSSKNYKHQLQQQQLQMAKNEEYFIKNDNNIRNDSNDDHRTENDSQGLSKILLDKDGMNKTKSIMMMMMLDKKASNEKFENLENMTKIRKDEDESNQQERRQKSEKFTRSRTLSNDSNCSSISKKYNPFNASSNLGGFGNTLNPYLEIGEIYDQNMIYYTVRLVATKFLLTGLPYFGGQSTTCELSKSLVPDQKVLVSIKHLSLMVMGNCIKVMPEALQLPLEIDQIALDRIREFNKRNLDDSTNQSIKSMSNNSSQDLEKELLQPIEESTPQLQPQKEFVDSQAINADNLELEIKDDHFGESTTTEILLNYPLRRSSCTTTQSKIDLEKCASKVPESTGAKPKTKFSFLGKLNCQPKGERKSEFHATTPTAIEQKENKLSVDEEKPPILPRRKSPAKELKRALSESPKKQNTASPQIRRSTISPITSPARKPMAPNPNPQFISDILMFYQHSDPVLRGDVQVIVGNFLHSILLSGQYNLMLGDLRDCFKAIGAPNHSNDNNPKVLKESEFYAKNSLNINRLLAILILGLRDEIHSVVIHALTSFDKIFQLVMLKHFNNLNGAKKMTMRKNQKYQQQQQQRPMQPLNMQKLESKFWKKGTNEAAAAVLPEAKITMHEDCDTQEGLLNEILMMKKVREDFDVANSMAKVNGKLSTVKNEYDGNQCDCKENNQTSLHEYNPKCSREYEDNYDEISLKWLLDEIRLCCHNKNWSVQNKYIEIITNFDIAKLQEFYDCYHSNFGDDNDQIGITYRRIFTNELIEFLGHEDFRVRNHAIQHLPQFIRNQCIIQADINHKKSNLKSICTKFLNDNHNQYQHQQQHMEQLHGTKVKQQANNQHRHWQNQGNNLSLLTDATHHRHQHQQQYYQMQQQYEQLQQLYTTNFNLVRELLNYRIFYGLSPTIGNLLNAKCLPSNQIEKLFANILYILTNKLMELNNKNLQIGVIAAIKTLLTEFNPIDFYEQWNEFNISSVCLQFTYENYQLATDLSCQNNLIDVTTVLLSADAIHNDGKTNRNFNEMADVLFEHIMKILNVYYHLLSNQKPILFGKSHKNDLFQNAKDTASINNFGYFGNDYLYIKIYNLLKISYDNYKIQINHESGENMMSLLKTCLNSLTTLLDLKEHSAAPVPEATKSSFASVLGTPAKKLNNSYSTFYDIKIIEEILQYLATLINYQPVDSIVCLRQLLKFLLGRNYANRRPDYEKFSECYLKARKLIFNGQKINVSCFDGAAAASNQSRRVSVESQKLKRNNESEIRSKGKDEIEVEYKEYTNLDEKLGELSSNKPMNEKRGNTTFIDEFKQEAEINLFELFACCMNFPLGKSKCEEDCAKHIKLFEPLVIFCLSLFMKSNAIVQKPILNLLSQLLEFNVTYSILDSKNVIFEQILRTLDLIESGIARNATVIVVPILRFLVNLSRQNDKKLITIPKIISHTNSLLANSSIRQCSISALKGLSFELFFNEMPLKRSSSKAARAMFSASSTPTTTMKSSGSTSSLNSFNNSNFLKNSNSTNFLTNDKELNTQKEVVLDMLEKFIDYSECSKVLVVLMLWRNIWIERRNMIPNPNDIVQQQQFTSKHHQAIEREGEANSSSSSSINSHATDIAGKRVKDNRTLETTIDSPIQTPHKSQYYLGTSTSPMAFTMSLESGGIFTIVSKDICEGKINVNDWNEFYILDSIFKNSDKNLLLESKIFLSLLTFFINKSIKSFNDLSLAIIILDNVILKAEEIYLVNHIKLYLNNMQKSTKNTNKDEEKFNYNQSCCDEQQQQQQQQYQYEQQHYDSHRMMKNMFTQNAITATATNEINYFANTLCEKLDQCISTLIKSNPEQQHQQQQCAGTGTSSVINFMNFTFNNSNYHRHNNIHLQLFEEFREPEPYNKFSKLVVKFVRIICKDSILKKDSFNAVFRLILEQNKFWQKYNLNNSSYENIKVEILRMFYIMTNQFNGNSYITIYDDYDDGYENDGDDDDDGNHRDAAARQPNYLDKMYLLEKFRDIDHKFVKRTLIREIVMKFPHPKSWNLLEIEVLLQDFMIILLTDARQFVLDLCEITKFRSLFVKNLIMFCDAASKDELFIILDFMMNNSLSTSMTAAAAAPVLPSESEVSPSGTTMSSSSSQSILQSKKHAASYSNLPIDVKIEMIIKIRTKVQYNRALQKLIEQIMQNEIEFHGKHIIEAILSEKNIQLDWILNSSNEIRCHYDDNKDATSVLDSSAIDENWLIKQIIKYSSITNPEQFVNILYDIKSELKLKQILYAENFNIKLILNSALKTSFDIMLKQFQNDCIQFNPHINYMNLNALARVSLHALKESLDRLIEQCGGGGECGREQNSSEQQQQRARNLNTELWYLSTCVIVLLENIKRIYNIGLMYINARILEKFIRDQVLKARTLIDSLIGFSLILSNYIKDCFRMEDFECSSVAIDFITTNDNDNNNAEVNDNNAAAADEDDLSSNMDNNCDANNDKTNEKNETEMYLNEISNAKAFKHSDANCDNRSTHNDIKTPSDVDDDDDAAAAADDDDNINDANNNDNAIEYATAHTKPSVPIAPYGNTNNKTNNSIGSTINSTANNVRKHNLSETNNGNSNNSSNGSTHRTIKGNCCDSNRKSIEIYTYCKCIDLLLKENLIWFELNESSGSSSSSRSSSNNNIHNDDNCSEPRKQRYELHLNTILEFIHIGIIRSIGNTLFYRKYKLQCRKIIESERIAQHSTAAAAAATTTAQQPYDFGIGGPNSDIIDVKLEKLQTSDENLKDELDVYGIQQRKETENDAKHRRKTIIDKAIFTANVIENDCSVNSENLSKNSLLHILKSIGVSLLRMNNFYAYAVTPFEIIQTHHKDYYGAIDEQQPNQRNPGNQRSQSGKLPSIPVEELSDIDVLKKFVKRLSIFGFTSRQQFEEYFMTFLLLINTDFNDSMVDVHEQFQIRDICLKAILELLITYKTFPIVGNKLSSFHHSTRWPKIKCDIISTKKLHRAQLLIPGTNVFYLPNLERTLSCAPNAISNSIIGTTQFQPNQYDLNFVWQLMENSNMEPDIKNNVYIKNFQYFREQSEIDFKSSSQLIFDVITQLVEFNHVLILPNLVKFCEICENRDQVKWIRQKVSKLYDIIPRDDTISHQHIIYLMCKTQSMLIPSTSDLSHLCSLISNYLKSSHVFIRNAALHGLLCLLECCSKTNTTIGKLSDELSMLRDLIIGYIIRHGVVEESALMFSDLHTKLVWTLNFSLIEMTMKFLPDCNLLSNSLVSANNLLKRTSNEHIYLCVLHGLERTVITNVASPIMRNKIEKLALELIKMDNERFTIPALKLLLSCVYIGSTKQLQKTELSNGIVQDDPEIIIQQTDKVDILLHCIKSSNKSAAKIYGKVLCQIVRDLVPPEEIITKVIKEFLAINQPHCEVIASIVHQVFRSAIDSSFLQMLQEWLICSLPTFLNLTERKSIWCLTVIFISASINFHLIKLFPVLLSNYNESNQQQQQIGKTNISSGNLYHRSEINLFVTSARDFNYKLNPDQKIRFKEVFEQYQRQQRDHVMEREYKQQPNSNRNNSKVFQLILDSLQ